MPIEQIRQGKFRQIIKDLSGGFNLFLDPTKINENEFTDYTNLISYSLGRLGNATKRNGFQLYDAVTSAGATILNILEYIKSGQNPLLLIKSTGKLESKTGTGAYSTIDSSDVTGKVKMITLSDIVTILGRNTSGSYSNNKILSNINNIIEYKDSSPIQALQTFTAEGFTPTIGATIGIGQWAYLMTFVYIDGTETPPMPVEYWDDATQTWLGYNAYLDSTVKLYARCTITSSAKAIKLNNLPLGNNFVVKRKLYRTKEINAQAPNYANFGYYYLDTIDNQITLYEDHIPDTQLTELYAVENLLKQYTSKKGCIHKNRLFTGNQLLDQTVLTPTSASFAGAILPNYDGRLIVAHHKIAYFENEFNFNQVFQPSTGLEVMTPTNKLIYKTTEISTSVNTGSAATMGIQFNNNSAVIDSYFQQFALFRALPEILYSGVSETGGVLSFTTSSLYPVNQGEWIYIKNVLKNGGGNFIPDGCYMVLSQTSYTNFTVSLGGLSSSGTYTAGTGYCYTKNFYIELVSRTTGTFNSTIPNQYIRWNVSGYPTNQFTITNAEDNLQNYSSTVNWSNLNPIDGGGLPLSFSSLNEITIEKNDNDEITAMANARDGVLIFKNKNIYKLYTQYDDPSLWKYEKVVGNIGCSDSETISSLVEIPIGEITQYMWYGNGKFYLWQGGGTPEPVSLKIQTLIDALTFTNIDSCYYAKKNWVLFSYQTSSTGGIFVFDLNNKTWYQFTNKENVFTLRTPIELRDSTLLLGNNDYRLYKYDLTKYQDYLYNTETTTYAQRDVTTKLITKLFDSYYRNVSKVMLKLFSSVASGTITINVYKDNAFISAGTIPSFTITSAITRINNALDLQRCKQVSIVITESNNQLISYQELAFDYKESSEEHGW